MEDGKLIKNNGNYYDSIVIEEKGIDLILDKIGYNWYHIIVYIITAITLIADGSEVYTIYLMAPVIKRQYNISSWMSTFMVSALFIGFGLGSLFCGILTKNFKRKWPFVISLINVIFFGVVCVIFDNIFYFIFCRFMIGVSIGIQINIPNALFEILPSKYRDFLIGSIYFFFKVGIIFFCLIVYSLMDDSKGYLGSKNWKLCTVLGIFPNIITLILVLIFYEESPRIYLWENDFDKGIKELERMAAINGVVITENDKIALKIFIDKEKNNDVKTQFEIIRFIFSKELAYLTITLLIIWIINSLVLYGNTYALPQIIEKLNQIKKTHNLIKEVIISNIIPLPSDIVTGLITSTALFGRKYTIATGFLLCMVFSLCGIFNSQNLNIFAAMNTFFITFSFNITKLYTAEVYHTRVRDSVSGYGNAFSRLGGILVPFLTEFWMRVTLFGPYYGIVLYSFIAFVLTLLLPYDSYGKIIDSEKTN